MKAIPGTKRFHYAVKVSVFLITVALIVGMVGCDGGESYTLTTTSTSGGSVAEPGEGAFTYEEGTVVNLVAAVAETEPAYDFVGWTGDVNTIADVSAAATTITMNDHYSITANFAVPIEIWDWCDLDAIRDNTGDFYLLMNDLDSTAANYTGLASPTANGGKGWQPIGALNYTFTGTFDGQGYEIRDLFINRPDDDLIGLFGCVEPGGVIRDIGVVNASVIGNWGVAGLVGENVGIISHCYLTGNVTGVDKVGGLVGKNFRVVMNSYSTGSVTGSGGCVGGLVGSNEGNVRTSYSTSSVTGNSAVGGLVGAGWYGGLTTSYSTGNVNGEDYVGGLMGGNSGGTVNNCYSTGNVNGEDYVGGLMGWNGEGTVNNCYSTGNVNGEDYVGGLMGWNIGGTVNNSFWDTEISGQATSDGGTGKHTEEMQNIITFSGAMWDIMAVALNEANPAYIWNIVDDKSYPFLSWQS